MKRLSEIYNIKEANGVSGQPIDATALQSKKPKAWKALQAIKQSWPKVGNPDLEKAQFFLSAHTDYRAFLPDASSGFQSFQWDDDPDVGWMLLSGDEDKPPWETNPKGEDSYFKDRYGRG
jgi:hypothetical protein